MDNQIKITAEISQFDAGTCRFTVDRPIYRGFIRFASPQAAQGSPLAERLFAIDGVTAVLVQDQQVTVSKKMPVNWRETGPQVGAAIRAHVNSGEQAISPEAASRMSAEDKLREKAQKILDEQINPAVASHGGMISLVDVKGTTLYIQMGGGCQGCGAANVTLRQGVETALREQIPEITEILDITDHAAGENPYYASHDTGR